MKPKFKNTLREKCFRFIPVFVFSCGLLLPVLGVLSALDAWPGCLLLCLCAQLLLEAGSWNRGARIAVLVALPLLAVSWLFALGGLQVLQDVGLAIYQHLQGNTAALPLVAGDAARICSLLIAVAAFFLTRSKLGFMPALFLAMGISVLVWLQNRMDLLPCLLPAYAGLICLALLDRHKELNPLRFLPFILPVVLLAFFLTPSGGVSVPAWKEWADDFRQDVLDRLFFTEPRDVFSLSSEGYYPQGLTQMGGKAEPTDHVVMQVSTPRLTYLRGTILNEYTGRYWKNTTGGRRYLWQSRSLESQRTTLFNMDLPAEALTTTLSKAYTVSVRLLDQNASTLFVPQRVRSLSPGGDLVPYFSNASEIYATRNLQAGDTYSVSACLFLAGDAGCSTLVNAAQSTRDTNYASILSTYTTLPSHLEQRVWNLAAEITKDLQTPYEKAYAIQNWLHWNYTYTLDTDYQNPDQDFVTTFLLQSKKGNCTHFASALTVLCRMAGLPARYVEGYLAEPDENGQAIVTGLDAHAWTEVYFEGFGWLTFDASPRRFSASAGGTAAESNHLPEEEQQADDTTEENPPTPTPEADEPEDAGAQDEQQPESTPSPTPEPENPGPTIRNADEAEKHTPFPWWLIWVLLLLLLTGARFYTTAPAFRLRFAPDEAARFDLWLAEAEELLHAMGLDRRAGETPLAYGSRLDRSGCFAGVTLQPLYRLLALKQYGRAPVGEKETLTARDTATLLRSEMKPKAKCRYYAKRFFRSPLR